MGISNPTDFRIDDSSSVNSSIGVNGRKHEKANSKIVDNNSNIAFDDPPDAYKCSANETVVVNTSCGNEV